MAKAFEKWAREQGISVEKWPDGCYILSATNDASLAWQAAQEDACRRMCRQCAEGVPVWSTFTKGQYQHGPKASQFTGYCAASPIREGMDE